MNYWEQKELEQLKIENAWLDDLSPFMKLMDSHAGAILAIVLVSVVTFSLGLLIGFVI